MISLFLTSLKRVHISISGDDLKRMGFVPSPIFNQILKEVLAARLDGKVSNTNEELTFVKREFGHILKKGEKA